MSWRAPGAPLSKPKTSCFPGPGSSPWLGPSFTAVSTANWFFSGPAPGELRWEFLAQQAHQGNYAVSQNWGLALGEDTAQSLACHRRGKLPAVCLAGAGRGFSVPCRTEAGWAPLLQVAGGDEGVGPPHSAQVDHRTVVGHLN